MGMEYGSYGGDVRDMILAQHVNDILRQVESLAAHPIKAECVDGVVYLRGKVETVRQMRFAEDVSRGLPGVRDVVNELNIYEPEESPLLRDLPPNLLMAKGPDREGNG